MARTTPHKEILTHLPRRLSALASLLQKPKANHKELQGFRAKVTTCQRELHQLLQERMQIA